MRPGTRPFHRVTLTSPGASTLTSPTGTVAGRPSNRSRLAAIAVVLALASPGARAIAETPSDQVRLPPNAQIGDYVGQDVMIPMRDGVKLHAEIWRPRGA